MGLSFQATGKRIVKTALSSAFVYVCSFQMAFAQSALLSNGYMNVDVSKKEIMAAEEQLLLLGKLLKEMEDSVLAVDSTGKEFPITSEEVTTGKVKAVTLKLTSKSKGLISLLKHTVLKSSDSQVDIQDETKLKDANDYIKATILKADDWGERIAGPLFFVLGTSLSVAMVALAFYGITTAGLSALIAAAFLLPIAGLYGESIKLFIKRGTSDFLLVSPGGKAIKRVLHSSLFNKFSKDQAAELVLKNKFASLNESCKKELSYFDLRLNNVAVDTEVNYQPGNLVLSLMKYETLLEKMQNVSAAKNATVNLELSEEFLAREKAQLVVISGKASRDFGAFVRNETLNTRENGSCVEEAYRTLGKGKPLSKALVLKYSETVKSYCQSKKEFLSCRDTLSNSLNNL